MDLQLEMQTLVIQLLWTTLAFFYLRTQSLQMLETHGAHQLKKRELLKL